MKTCKRGELIIKHQPCNPNKDQKYWCVSACGTVVCNKWSNVWMDTTYYKFSNCYHTREEAEANCDKWVAFYASDAVLEV